MTEAEKQEIVGLVMTQISSQAVDFDIATEEPKANDLLTAVRETESGGYRGVTIKWDDVARIATELANQAAKRAEDAKASIVASEENVTQLHGKVQEMKTSITSMRDTVVSAEESAVASANASSQSESNANTYMQNSQRAMTAAETAQGKAEEAKGIAENAKQGAEGARDTAKDYMKSAQQSAETSASNVERLENVDFRQKSTGKAILDVDITGTMEAFIDGMEEEPNEAIALTLEPDVPTSGSHNFGVRGQICIDSNYLYVCTALNTWKKISLLDL